VALPDRVVDAQRGTATVAILDQHLSPETQFGFLAWALAVQHGVGIGVAGMRVVAPPLAFELDRGIAGIIVLGALVRRGVGTILAHETFQTGPGLDQGAVGTEVLVTGPLFLAAELIDLVEEQLRPFTGENALLILTERAVIPGVCVQGAIQKPQLEDVVGKLFAEEPFRADRIQRHQQAGLEQLFGWNRRAAPFGVERFPQRAEFAQGGIGESLDRPQGMIGGDSGFHVDQGTELGLRFDLSTHAEIDRRTNQEFKPNAIFSTTC